jgi:AcrR family transcriptional regulator
MARTVGADGQKTAQRILDQSLPLIAKLGYSAVSMRMIASAVGVNVGALYNHFPNKQQILVRLMTDHMNALLAGWHEIETDGLSPAGRMEQFVRFHIAFNIPRSEDVFISFMELRSLEPENHKMIEGLRSQYENVVASIIRDGSDAGQFNVADTHVATMSVLGSLIGVNTWYRETGRLSKSKIQDYYVNMTFGALGYTSEEDANV